MRFACGEKPKHRADIISKFLQPLFPRARFSAGLVPDYFLQCRLAVTRECARVIEMASGRHGGVRLVQVTGPPRRLEQLTMETELMRQGYTIVWPGRSATPVVRSAALHQHTVLMCFGEACVEDSLLWIHLLSEASPRRHIAVVVGTGRVAAGGWNEYSAAGTIWADTAIGRGRFQLARDRLHSLATEAALRKAPVPDSLRNCAAELAFWFGDRDPPDFGAREEPGSTELGWRRPVSRC